MQRRRLAIYSVAAVIVVAICSSFASRAALGLVVNSCKLSYSLANSAFPCLKLVEETHPLQSYAILREPTHRERTILTPLAAVSGIEDKRLLAPDAPNYFADAWNERSVVMSAHPEKDAWQDSALAINAASNRTQDHLHIHMGCIPTRFKRMLVQQAGVISDDRFQKFTTRLPWRSFWIKSVKAENLSAINPVQIVASEVPGARDDMEDVAIGVVGAPSSKGQREFYILAQILSDDTFGSAEDIVDPKCRR